MYEKSTYGGGKASKPQAKHFAAAPTADNHSLIGTSDWALTVWGLGEGGAEERRVSDRGVESKRTPGEAGPYPAPRYQETA